MIRRSRSAVATALASAVLAACAGAQQRADNSFDMSVQRPAHTARHPRLAIDEGHNNFHTAAGRYAPFAALMRNDGYRVAPSAVTLTKVALDSVEVLVIANPAAPGIGAGGATSASAFTDAECDAVRDWVRAGGALLLIADHAPFGSAAENLAGRFDVNFGKGFVHDTAHFLAGRGPTMLMFDHERLGAHAIMNGRDESERIRTVVSFTGQSMSIPAGADALLRLSPTAGESPTREDLASLRGVSAAGRAQGIAMPFGRGRLVMLGEAAMMSAQLAAGAADQYGAPFKMGMNHPGSDDKQFALNVVRWLSRALE